MAVVVIPARMSSTRFPGKPLCDLEGKPMLQWVFEAALDAKVASEVVVATPDDEIIEACKAFGARAVLTSASHESGTDRIAEVAKSISADFYVNVQGDEPLIDPATIRACAMPLQSDANVQMSSVYCDCRVDELENPAVVKVVTALNGDALYFSRFPIPYARNARATNVKRHLGVYAYRREILQSFSTWERSALEVAESLEQLRFLENGVKIRMARGIDAGVSVDTPDQADEVRRLLRDRRTRASASN